MKVSLKILNLGLILKTFNHDIGCHLIAAVRGNKTQVLPAVCKSPTSATFGLIYLPLQPQFSCYSWKNMCINSTLPPVHIPSFIRLACIVILLSRDPYVFATF